MERITEESTDTSRARDRVIVIRKYTNVHRMVGERPALTPEAHERYHKRLGQLATIHRPGSQEVILD